MCYASLRWQTWVQSRAQVISLQIITVFAIFVAVALHACMKDREAEEICDFFPFTILCLYLKLFKPGTNRPNKMAKEMYSKQHKFRDFPEISQSFIYTYSHSNEKNSNVEC